MKVLLTNDDGIESPGIVALGRELLKVADVLLVAPEHEKSGTSHAITLRDPVEYKAFGECDGLAGYVVKGTPVDCVRLAVERLDIPFDLVVSGINAGANVGLNIHYSGTVAAALEAAFLGRKGLAVSVSSRAPGHLDCTASIAADLAAWMAQSEGPLVLNLNVPDLPREEIRGVRVTRNCTTEEETLLATNKNNNKILEECGEEDFVIDSGAVAAGFISVTPLQLDMTAYDRLEGLQAWEWQGLGK